MDSKIDVFKYQTVGTCSKMITVAIKEDKIVDIEYIGGCNGNLRGISSLVIGLSIDDVINKLQGITCGNKQTSCPDQLAQCLLEYKAKKLAKQEV